MEHLASLRTQGMAKAGDANLYGRLQTPLTPVFFCSWLQVLAPPQFLLFRNWVTLYHQQQLLSSWVLRQLSEKKNGMAGTFPQGATILITTCHLEQAQGNQIQKGTVWLT